MANLIRDELQETGVSIPALADALSVSRIAVMNWLSGVHEPPTKFLWLLQLIGGPELASALLLRIADREASRELVDV